MDYRLIITKQVEKMLDHLIHYLIYRIKNCQAANAFIGQHGEPTLAPGRESVSISCLRGHFC